ncbi:sensor domain-containing diguanylate cyclase [Oceanobacter kriegii]|uniref:sensor domain-containing diguanylate cyclase n=1 Tax=Oceanobacter kriegii TaxID=64972 RepID=UPI0004235206|nr:diguanylate cyclase [Oceanobacter kriegii]
MEWYLRCLLISLFLGLPSTLLAGSLPEPIQLNSDHFVLNEPPVLRIRANQVRFARAPEEMTAADVYRAPGLDWIKPATDSITFGRQEDPVWLRLRLENHSPDPVDRILEVGWATMQYIGVYEVDVNDDGPVWSEARFYESGFTVSPDRYYERDRHHIFPLQIGGLSSIEVLIKIESDFLIMAPMVIWPREDHDDFKHRDLGIHALLLGMLLALFLYNIAIAGVTRDISYVYYVMYLGSMIIYIMAATGWGHYLLWGHYDLVSRKIYPLSIYCSMIFGALFVRHFLRLNSVGGWYIWINNLTIAYWTSSLILVGSGIATRGFATDLFAMATMVLSMVYGVTLWQRNHQGARMFTVAWFGMILSTMVNVLMIKGLLPYSYTGQYFQVGGVILEVILLAIALADRMNWERSLRAKAQQRAYELQLAINKERESNLKAKEELLTIEKQTNRQLEKMVADRTRELENLTTHLESANQELTRLSVTDALTGVMNRRYFDTQISKEVRRCSRVHEPLSILMLDADHFKQVNDQHGHPVGDACLRTMASRIEATFSRPGDCVARYGGEEFAVILPNTPLEDAADMAERLRLIMQESPIQTDAGDLRLTISIGISGCYPDQHTEDSHLLNDADEALYEAKGSGRNRVVVKGH